MAAPGPTTSNSEGSTVMGVLRFLWQRVLAFDRIGSRIPQLIQIWLIEFFFAMPLMFFIGKLIDIHGAFGVPGTGERIDGVFWGALVVSLVFGFFSCARW